jgi:hypothetical protein
MRASVPVFIVTIASIRRVPARGKDRDASGYPSPDRDGGDGARGTRRWYSSSLSESERDTNR